MNYEFKKTLPVYRYSYAKALSRKEEQAYEASFQENVRCAQDIKETIYRHFNLETKELKPGCAEYILQRYGPLRTSYVLANTFQTEGCPSCFGEKIAEWSRDVYGLDAFAPHDHRFLVNVASIPLSMFISQMSEAYHALGFFGLEHCIGDKYTTEYRGKCYFSNPTSDVEAAGHSTTNSGTHTAATDAGPVNDLSPFRPAVLAVESGPVGFAWTSLAYLMSSIYLIGLWKDWKQFVLPSRKIRWYLLWALWILRYRRLR